MMVAFLFKVFTTPHIALIHCLVQLGIHIRHLWFADIPCFKRSVFIQYRREWKILCPVNIINIIEYITNMKRYVTHVNSKWVFAQVLHTTVGNLLFNRAWCMHPRSYSYKIMKVAWSNICVNDTRKRPRFVRKERIYQSGRITFETGRIFNQNWLGKKRHTHHKDHSD